MNFSQHSIVALALVALLPAICRAEGPYLKEMPEDYEIPYGKVLYVDDSPCSAMSRI